jgi:hypothetical protein
LHQLFAYVLKHVHFPLASGLARQKILLGVIFWFFLHGGLFMRRLFNASIEKLLS